MARIWMSVIVFAACSRSLAYEDAGRDSLPNCSDTSGTHTVLFDGELLGMDTTRVYVWSGVLQEWPKAGGMPVVSPVQPQGRPNVFATSAGTLYWDVAASIVATEPNGDQRTIPLPDPPFEIAAAPGGGVFLHTGDASGASTIEMIAPGALASQTVVSGNREMAVGGDSLVWVRADGQLERRQLSTGIDLIFADQAQQPLHVTSNDVISGRFRNSFPYQALERHRLDDGTLLASYPVPTGAWGPTGIDSASIGADATDLYVSEHKGYTAGGPAGSCPYQTGLFRVPLDGGAITQLDPDAGTMQSGGTVLVDDQAVYYTIDPVPVVGPDRCCIGNGNMCPPVPVQVGCYRK